MPLTAIERYEALRAEVLIGHGCPEGLGAVVYHGMLHGLALIMTRPSATPPVSCGEASAIATVPHDRQLVRLLANMLLRTQSEVVHVY
ncbi:MAG: hypothetical protein KDF55_16705 [Thauera sp.]|nr:hypothetical protein [Thauera sp.]